MKEHQRQKGQGLVEFALLLVLVAIVVIAILSLVSSSIILAYAQAMGGLHGQTITGTGKEAVVLYSADISRSGSFCTATVPAGTTVIVLNDGEPVEDTTIDLHMQIGTTAIDSLADVTTDGNGIGETSSTASASATCGQLSYTSP